MAVYKLKDICLKIGSGATPRGGKEAYCDEGISLIRSQNVLDFVFSHDGLAHINEQQADKLSNVEVKPQDILLNITGDSVARACAVDVRVLPARVNQHVAIIRPDEDKVLSSYILFFLQMIKPYLLQIAAGGATRNALTKSMIKNLEIDVPDILSQKKIVAVLDDIQEKIRENKEINKNLEQQAQAIYSRMFIEHRQESGNPGQLADLISVKYGKDHKKLADGNYPVYGSGGIMRYVEKPLYTGESVLIPRKGTLNNVMYVDGAFWSVDTMFYTEMLRPNIAKFVYHFLKGKDLASLNAGSAVPSMTTNILNAMQLYIPDEKTLEKFENIVSPMYSAMQENTKESKLLANTRDILLPKLMSGELDVSDIDL
ncbi:restriction endonuclease subunit S [Coprococcus sp. AF21-14LB]|uniref:restriction endonuclease subunit S n=1 Tax=Coprococcus sp. AF21-14LB TaxID=2292231 RepID=UPI000E4BC365|nr:restriction endonuclease subunit S [Coprococcus sp. AF21-14LB]RGS82144.1 restriction endonuclease subunit S [Coprococcus sp. AF21-14LB]